jgi:hypothetical protein
MSHLDLYNKQYYDDALKYINSIDIDYLSLLDRHSLLQLSQTSQYFNNIINQIFKNKLYKSIPNFYLNDYINIANALFDLHNQVMDIFIDNYNELPIWVNKVLFTEHMVDKIYNHFMTQYKKLRYELDEVKFISLDRTMLGFPLVSVGVDLDRIDYYVTQDMDSFLIIPKTLTIYLNDTNQYVDMYLSQLLLLSSI